MQACDHSFPIEEKRLDAGFVFEIWVGNEGAPGKYATPEGEAPARLGIMIDMRHREVFVVRSAFTVIASIAALFPLGKLEQVGGLGGGIQYFLPPEWQTKLERIV